MSGYFNIHPNISSNIFRFQRLIKMFTLSSQKSYHFWIFIAAVSFSVVLGLNHFVGKIFIHKSRFDCYQQSISYADYLSNYSGEGVVFKDIPSLRQLIQHVSGIVDFNCVAFTDVNDKLILHDNQKNPENCFFFNPLTNEAPIDEFNGVSIKKGMEEGYRPFLIFIKDIMYKKEKVGHVYFSVYASTFNEKLKHVNHRLWSLKTLIPLISSFMLLFIWFRFQHNQCNDNCNTNSLTKISEGGVCNIFLDRYLMDNGLGVKVCLKMLKSHFARQSFFHEKLLSEAFLLRHLNHPNIVKVYGFDQHKKAIVMEYIDGINLYEFLNKHSHQLSMPIKFYMIVEICKGLRCLHENQIVHLDLTLKNILISNDGWMKIIDFGIAKTIEALRQGSINFYEGTLNYMSPEQIYAESVDERSDIYSFGVMAYRVLTGKALYTFKDIENARNTINNACVFYDHRIPKRLEIIINKCIIKEKLFRYQNAIALYGDLCQLMNSDTATFQYDIKNCSKQIKQLLSAA
ncbi:MAG: serine/threonine protein kinase [Candidatus Magnetomorum sp.]|nr:serine/threonine protein kinase [Candidatus Magnetomorum sp.]